MADGVRDAAEFYGTAPDAEASLELPPLPDEVAELWIAFTRMSARRSQAALGPGPLTYADMRAYELVNGMRFSPWEVEVLEALDGAWLADRASAAAGKPGDGSAGR